MERASVSWSWLMSWRETRMSVKSPRDLAMSNVSDRGVVRGATGGQVRTVHGAPGGVRSFVFNRRNPGGQAGVVGSHVLSLSLVWRGRGALQGNSGWGNV